MELFTKTSSTFKLVSSLEKLRARRKNGVFPVEGVRIVTELLKTDFKIRFIIIEATTLKTITMEKVKELAIGRGVSVRYTDKQTFDKLANTKEPQGVIALAEFPERKKHIEKKGNYVFIEKCSNPGNLGTIIRTLDFFKYDGIILSPESVDPYSPKVVRSTMGSIFRLPIYENLEFDELKILAGKFGIKTYAFVPDNGEAMEKIDEKDNFLLVFGPETGSLPQKITNKCDMGVTITGNENTESLNLSVAVSIAAFHFCKS